MDVVGKEEIRDLLGKGWLTHDGMWFYSVYMEYGIAKANKLNKDAIKSMVPFEVQRLLEVIHWEWEKNECFAYFEFSNSNPLFNTGS
jgi:hypothetical protein